MEEYPHEPLSLRVHDERVVVGKAMIRARLCLALLKYLRSCRTWTFSSARGYCHEMKVVISEYDQDAISMLVKPTQGFEIIGPAIDEIAHTPDNIF